MEVKDRLSRSPVGVDNRSVAPGLDAPLPGDLPSHPVEVPHHGFILFRHLSQGSDVPLGHHEHMGRSLGMEVVESEGQLILIHRPGGSFPGNDLTEQAVQNFLCVNSSGVPGSEQDRESGFSFSRRENEASPAFKMREVTGRDQGGIREGLPRALGVQTS